MTQVITLPTADREITNGRNYKGEKFLVYSLQLLLVTDAHPESKMPIIELAELCIWTGRSSSASKFYATLWVHYDPYYVSGFGTASGHGYCKASHAAYHAFCSAGLAMSEPFDGHGMSEVRKAMLALGVAMGACPFKLHVNYGA